MEFIDRVKKHFRDNADRYAAFGAGAAFVGIAVVIVRGRYETLANGGVYGSETAETSITMRPHSILSAQTNVVSVTNNVGRGFDGYLVRDIDTNKYYASQRAYARKIGVSEPVISKYFNGKLPNAGGHQAERIRLEDVA